MARNLSGGRAITARDSGVLPGCNTNACKGIVSLAFKFPRLSPRQSNPFSFSLYFVVATETESIVSQSLDEQASPQAAGLASLTGFSQVRNLSGTGSGLMGEDKLNNLCQVMTAASEVDIFGNVVRASILMPRTLPAATPGSLDGCFGAGGKRITGFGSGYAQANASALQSDGKIVVAGFSENGGNYDFALVRYNTIGSLDTTFGTGGKLTTGFGSSDDVATAITIQSDGKIVVAGYSFNGSNNDFALARYNPNGSLDTSFDTDGKLTTAVGLGNDQGLAMALQGDGKIVVTGYSYNGSNNDFALARYNTNGSLDSTFDGDGKLTTGFFSSKDDVATAVAIQSDGKIVAAGYIWNGGNNDFGLARYNTNGSLDTTFDTDGKVTTGVGFSADLANSIVIQNDGKIVAAGYSSNGSNTDFALVRYNSNGSLDTTFDTDGMVTTAIGSGFDFANAIVLQSDGKFVLAGYSFSVSNYDFALARYNPNGSLDTTFGTGGSVTTPIGASDDIANALAIQNDGKIVVAGYSLGVSGIFNHDFAMARYNP